MVKTQDPISELFMAHIEKKKFSAGFLLSGEENEKKKQVAIRFAKALNCEEKKYSPECQCGSCLKIDSGNHPDIRWYGLDEDERSIKIEAVRNLQEWLNLKPYEGKVKVFLLNVAERLTTDAQNALLKSLEEPPPHSVLLLLAKKRSDLLETVVSRLQEIKIPPFEEKEMVQILIKEGIGGEEARFLARYSAGNLESAKALHESGWFTHKNNFLRNLLQNSATGLDSLATKQRKEILDHITLLMTWVRDACVLKSEGKPSLMIHEDFTSGLESFLKNRSLDALMRFYGEIEATGKALDENANMKLAVSKLQVNWKEFSDGR